MKLLNLYPAPSLPGIFNNYVAGTLNSDDNYEFDVRVDHNFSDKDTMFARYILSNTTNSFPGPFPGLAELRESLVSEL